MNPIESASVGESYGHAWTILWRCFPELLLTALLWGALSLPGGVLHHAGARLPALLYHLLVAVPVNFGGLYVCLRAARGQSVHPSDLFEPFRGSYLQTILAHVLFVVIVGAGLVMLVVPGIWIATRLAFVGFLVVDEGMDAPDAMRESWRRTQGFGGSIFLLFLLALLIGLGGLLCFGAGIVPAFLWAHLALASLYVRLSGEPGAAPTSRVSLASA